MKDLVYAVSCDINVQATIKWRTLSLKFQEEAITSTPSYSKIVSGVEGCQKDNGTQWKLGNGYAGGAVAALVPPLSEGRFWNGMTNTIFNQALRVNDTSDRYSTVDSWKRLIRKAPYGFENSANALEDVLGLTAGITMSQMSTLGSNADGSPLKDTINFHAPVAGHATFQCTRIGSGNRSALLFTLPALLTMSVAIYLLFTVPRRPTTYKTSHLEDLIGIGQATDLEINSAYIADKRLCDDEQILARADSEASKASIKLNATETGRAAGTAPGFE